MLLEIVELVLGVVALEGAELRQGVGDRGRFGDQGINRLFDRSAIGVSETRTLADSWTPGCQPEVLWSKRSSEAGR